MSGAGPTSPPRAEADELFVMPASVGQKRFWLLEQMTPGNTALNIPIALDLAGPLDESVLERALQAVVDRHEILRTRFELIDGEPQQVIATQVAMELERAPDEAPSNATRAERVRLAMDREAERPLNFGRAPLLRSVLLELSPQDHVLMLTAHHIISDGWSNGVLVREIASGYEALRTGAVDKGLPPLAIQYADYVAWQEEWLKTPEFARQIDYWRGRLGGTPPVLDFPTDFPRRTVQPSAAILESRLLPAPLTEALKALCREQAATLFMVLMAAYVALLHRYTGQSRVLVGTTAANRNKPELESLIGLFANLLVVSGEVDGAMSFGALLARQRDQALGAFAHHEAPFELILQELQQAGVSRVPMQTHFLFQRAFMQPAQVGELAIRPLHSVSPGSTFELTFGIVERAEGIRLQMEYRTSLYRRETIQRFLLHFEQLLAAATANPDTSIADLPLFADGEREEIEARLKGRSSHSDPIALASELDRQIERHLVAGRENFTPVERSSTFTLAVLDPRGRAQPLDLPGMVWLAGPTPMALPFLGRNMENGRVELWGRASDIVAVRGFRFNLRAIEVHLGVHPAVVEAAVSRPSTSGRLHAQVVLKQGTTVSGEELRTWLRGRLSDLIVPATIRVAPTLARDAEGRIAFEEGKINPAPATVSLGNVSLPALVQQQLLEIWRRLLKTDDLRPESNFFEIGGNSFLALRMMVEAGKLAGRELPLSLLLRGATVRELAAHLLADANEKSAEVIAVQPVGTEPPLFFLHGDWIGGGFYCHRLARDLGPTQPFYALPPFHLREERISTMREMAAFHCAVLRRERPAGPYRIGGYCIGAVVAIEVARLLVAEGETVDHLVLVDPPLWGGLWLRELWPWADRLGRSRGWNLERRIALFDRTAVALDRWRRKPLGVKLTAIGRRLGWKPKAAPAIPPADSGFLEDDAGGAILNGLDFSTYYMTYRLHRFTPLAVPATLLLPESTVAGRRAQAAGRSRLHPSGVAVEAVAGNHTTCITQHTAELAAAMRKAFAAAGRRASL